MCNEGLTVVLSSRYLGLHKKICHHNRDNQKNLRYFKSRKVNAVSDLPIK